ASYDFAIIPVTASRSQDKLRDQLLEAKGVPTKLFVHLKIDQDDTGAVPHIMETLRALGIKHYGIASGNDLYGYNESNIAKEMAKGTLAVFGG
ncbi:MAG: hypothetical protein PVG89_04110, partial [Gammaproteobacteria bacterium]